jgi:hypothetical protein
MELAQDRVQWQSLILAVLNLRVLLPEIYLINLLDHLLGTFINLLNEMIYESERPEGMLLHGRPILRWEDNINV